MKRVIIVGPGAAGKSTLAARLGGITGLPVIELDKLFWRPGLAPTPRDEWAVIQRRLAAQESWIMDGDLGPYDVLDVRLHAADAIVSWTSRRSAVPGAPSAGHPSAPTSGNGCCCTAAAAVPCSGRRSPHMSAMPMSTSCRPRARSGDSSRR
jgi:hypothetical protein